jgi:hypothetical protein
MKLLRARKRLILGEVAGLAGTPNQPQGDERSQSESDQEDAHEPAGF